MKSTAEVEAEGYFNKKKGETFDVVWSRPKPSTDYSKKAEKIADWFWSNSNFEWNKSEKTIDDFATFLSELEGK